MSLEDIYNDVSKSMEDKKPTLIEFMETHIDFETIIPTSFYNVLYRHRVVVERTINLVKESFVLDSRKTFRSVSAKADTYLCAITQLVGVLLADSIHNFSLFKSLRKLIA